MMAFLTVCYCGVVWLISYKLRLIKPTTPAKIAYAAVYIAAIMGIVISMNMYAPYSKDVRAYAYTVQVASRVSGIITSVAVKDNVQVKKGDVLFEVQPELYQQKVKDLEARLAEAKQNVPQLKAALDAALANVQRAESDREFARLELERQRAAAKTSAVSERDVDKAGATLASREAGLLATRAEAEKARLAYGSEIGGVNTAVASLEAQLETARIDLHDSVVRAPADGLVLAAQLREGTIAPLMPTPYLSLLVDEDYSYIITLTQNAVRFIQPGDPAEVGFPKYPGRVFKAKVKLVSPATGEGQLSATGLVPTSEAQPESRSVVKLVLEDVPDDVELAAGIGGMAVIFTSRGKAVHIIPKVMLRMYTWLNFF